MASFELRRALYPDRYLLVLFGFFVLFPLFMDVITPDVASGYAGGSVNAQGEAVSRYEGGTTPQYQWYYPLLYPFILFWYLAVVGFGFLDVVVPDAPIVYQAAELVYFYLLAALLGACLRPVVSRLAPYLARALPERNAETD